MDVLRSIAAWLLTGLTLCGLSLACAPAAAPPAKPTPSVDAFAVVRATSQAAYASGKAHLDRGEYLQACVELDAARTTDPDGRPEIQQALEQALQRCLTPPPEPTAAQLAGSAVQRTIVVATLPAATSAPLPAASSTPPPATATAPSAAPKPGGGTPSASAAGTPVGPGGGTPSTSAPPLNLVAWSDPQGRFSIGAPSDWTRIDKPQTFFGTGVVGFRDPSGHAKVDLAVDTNAKAVSPELYAASLELAMQQQVPGYASEQVLPGSTAGNPSIRRVFTFTQRDAAGQDHQARGFQVTVVKGSTPYIISGSAPAEQFQQYSATFDRIVENFRFS